MLTPVPGALRDVVTPEQITARAEILAKLQAQLGLNAAAVGERDLALGLKELRRLAKAHRLKLLAANLVDGAGKPAFESGFVTEVAGVKVGLFGVTEVPEGQAAPIKEAGLKTLPPAEVATKEVARLRGLGATVVVALAHVGTAGARALLTKVPGIDFAVVGHTSSADPIATRAGTGYFAEAHRQGKQIGAFKLHVIAGQPGFVDGGRRQGLVALMDRQRKDYERFSTLVKNEANASRREMYLVRLRRLHQDLAANCGLAKEPAPAGGSWFEHTLAMMNRAVPDDAEIADAVRKYKEAAPKSAAVPPPGVRAPPAASMPPAGGKAPPNASMPPAGQ